MHHGKETNCNFSWQSGTHMFCRNKVVISYVDALRSFKLCCHRSSQIWKERGLSCLPLGVDILPLKNVKEKSR